MASIAELDTKGRLITEELARAEVTWIDNLNTFLKINRDKVEPALNLLNKILERNKANLPKRGYNEKNIAIMCGV